MPTSTHKLQKQQQELIHNNNKKNRILIMQGDDPDNYATLKLDLEINGFIVDTFADQFSQIALRRDERRREMIILFKS
jgi:hypothetical protein